MAMPMCAPSRSAMLTGGTARTPSVRLFRHGYNNRVEHGRISAAEDVRQVEGSVSSTWRPKTLLQRPSCPSPKVLSLPGVSPLADQLGAIKKEKVPCHQPVSRSGTVQRQKRMTSVKPPKLWPLE